MKRIAMLSLLAVVLCVDEVFGQVVGDTISELNVIGKQEKKLKSSSPVYSMSDEDMLRLGVTDITDALHRLPGITLRDYGGAGGIKTVSVRGFGSQHTGVSYDGMMLNEGQNGEIDLHRYTLDNLKTLSLSVGEKDDIFVTARSNSTAATINLETEKWKGVMGKITTGAWGMINPMIGFGVPISDNLSLSANVDYLHADNNYPFTLMNVATETREHRSHSKMDQMHGEFDLKWQMGNSTMLATKAYYYNNERELPGIVHYYTDENDENLHERNAFIQARLKSILTEKVSLMLNGKWDYASTEYHNGMPSGGVTSADYWQREYYGSGAIMYSPTDILAFDYSVDYFVNSLNTTLNNTSHANRKSLLQSFAGKLSEQRLTLVARALWSNYFGEAHRLSPAFSLSYKIIEDADLYFRASFKEIFRMPSFKELYFFHLGDTDLKPENTRQINLGLTHQGRIGDRMKLSLTLDGYYNWITDKIVSVPINMFVWRNINMAKVVATGIDATLALTYDINKVQSVEIAGNYSLQRVMNKTDKESPYFDNQIAYTPLHSGSVTLSWKNPWVNLSATYDGMGERWTTNEHSQDTRLAGFMEFSASAFRNFTIKKTDITIRASMMNILDKQYDIVAHYPMPGRSWKISFAVKY
ncbi:MAG: TonB-dependent receptor [Prevotellaceae bacterium]|nr:TonB-dependent receptor [Prevotellaceae bacterium]